MTGSLSTILIALFAAGGAVIVAAFKYDTGGGLMIVGTGLLIVMFFLLPRLVGEADRKFMRQLTFFALGAKITASILFVFVFSTVVGDGLKDSAGYSREGARIASLLRDGDLSVLVTHFGIGTAFLQYLTGIIFWPVGSTLYGGFAIFSMFALIGSLLFYKAFVIAVPNGKSRLYAVLVMLFPAVLFWTSAIGKDATVFFFAGLTAYGMAMALVQGKKKGFPVLTFGLTMIYFARPEIAAVFAVAIVPAMILWILRGFLSAPGRSLLVLGATLVITAVGISALPSVLEVEDISIGTVTELLLVQTRNEFDPGGDGSNFDVTPITSPAWVPMAFVTTLMRPFPGELNTPQGIVQSAEGVLLAVLLILNFKSGLLSIGAVRREPYMVFTLVFAVAMILILSTTANFGLLARLRVILLPAVFTMVAYRPMRKMPLESAHRESEDRIEGVGRVATAN